MKKSILKFLIIIFTIFNIGIIKYNAAMKSKDCTYMRTYKGDDDSSENFTFTVRVTPIAVLGKVTGLKYEVVNGSSQFKGNFTNNSGKKSSLEIVPSTSDMSSVANSIVDTSNGVSNAVVKECPTFFYEDVSATSVKIYDVATKSDSQQPFDKLKEVDSSGDIITGDKENTSNKTSCTLKVATYDTVSNDKINENVTNRMVSLTFDSYEDGRIYVSCAGCIGNGYLEKSSSGDVALTLKRNLSTVFNQQEIKIYNSDVDDLKKKFRYGMSEDDCPEELTLNKYEEDDSVAISDKPRNDASSTTTAKKNYTVDGNADFFPPSQIGTDKSSCEDILGDSLIEFLQNAWTTVKVVSIVLVLAFNIMDFVGTVGKDKDALMESVNKSIKRLVIVILILLLPTFIDLIGNLLGQNNILCGIK